jgi:AcrR family transcriptional regulator
MRKKDEKLKQRILSITKNMIKTKGYSSINIREISKEAGIASGTIYNYFSSKDEILLSLTEEFWKTSLIELNQEIQTDFFYIQLEEVYKFLNQQINQSAGLLMGSLINVEIIGREYMQSMHKELGKILLVFMDADCTINNNIWTNDFTKEQYINFVIFNMINNLQIKSDNTNFFIQIVKRTIY